MTAAQAAKLHFDGKPEATKKRLQKLKAAKLIGERRQSRFQPAILFLTRSAFSLLQERGILEDYPRLDSVSLDKRSRVSDSTLRHELEVMDVKAAMYAALPKAEGFSIAEFCTWPLLNQFEAMTRGYAGREVLVKPDGFVRIHEKESDGTSEHAFFLELDRSSEVQDRLVAQAGRYVDYYASGGFAVRNGASTADFKNYPFRVLMVFKTAERRNNTAARLLLTHPPILTMVHLSTLPEVMADPFGSVWMRPIDYREATQGTPFASEQQSMTLGYRRQTERELFVEKHVRKSKLLLNEDAGG